MGIKSLAGEPCRIAPGLPGPVRVHADRPVRLRREAPQSGLDPNIWFRNVEIIAARDLRGETVQYVSNIYKYYIAYRSIIRDLKLKREKKMVDSSGP